MIIISNIIKMKETHLKITFHTFTKLKPKNIDLFFNFVRFLMKRAFKRYKITLKYRDNMTVITNFSCHLQWLKVLHNKLIWI